MDNRFEIQIKPPIDILGTSDIAVKNFHRSSLAHKVWTVSDIFRCSNVIPDRIYDVHEHQPPVWNGMSRKLYIDAYNEYAEDDPNFELWVNKKSKNFGRMNRSALRYYDFSIVGRFGGAGNFQQSISYILAHAIVEGHTDITINSVFFLGNEEYVEQLPSFLDMLEFVARHFPAVNLKVDHPEILFIWRLERPLLPKPESVLVPYHRWEQAHLKNDKPPGVTEERAKHYFPRGIRPKVSSVNRSMASFPRMMLFYLYCRERGVHVFSTDEDVGKIVSLDREFKEELSKFSKGTANEIEDILKKYPEAVDILNAT